MEEQIYGKPSNFKIFPRSWNQAQRTKDKAFSEGKKESAFFSLSLGAKDFPQEVVCPISKFFWLSRRARPLE